MPEQEIYRGETECDNYLGVDNVKEKRCCGGKRTQVAEVNCKIHKIISASDGCRSQICEYFQGRGFK